MTIMVGTLEVEEVPARVVAVGDHLVLGNGSSEYPVRQVETVAADMLRFQVGLLRGGLAIDDHGAISAEPWRIVRRTCR